jgi:hypothetical protein
VQKNNNNHQMHRPLRLGASETSRSGAAALSLCAFRDFPPCRFRDNSVIPSVMLGKKPNRYNEFVFFFEKNAIFLSQKDLCKKKKLAKKSHRLIGKM